MSEINKVGDIIEFNATDGSDIVIRNNSKLWKRIRIYCKGGLGGANYYNGRPDAIIANMLEVNLNTIDILSIVVGTAGGYGRDSGGDGGHTSVSINYNIVVYSLGSRGGKSSGSYIGDNGVPRVIDVTNVDTSNFIEFDVTNEKPAGFVRIEILEMYPPDTEVDNVLGNNINDIEFAKLEDISSSTKLSQEEIQEYGFEKFFKSTKVDNELTYEHSPFHRFISEEHNTLIGMGYEVGSCFTKDNGLVSWGADAQIINNQSQRLAPVVQLSVYGYHGLVLLADGTAVAWGRDSENQVSHTPKKKFKYVSAGDYFNGGILETGEVVFWGALGGTQMNGNGHSNTNGILNGIQLACGVDGGLLLKDDGYIVGIGGWAATAPKDKKYIYVCASYKNRGAIRAEDGVIEIWGESGAIISGKPKTGGFYKMALHDNGGIALRPDGTYEAWGNNTSTYDKNIPDVVDVIGGRGTVAVIQKDGTITIWGAERDKIIATTRAIAPKIKNMVFEKNKDILPVVIGKDAIKKYNGYFTNEKDINNHDIEMNRYIDMIALSGSDFYNVEAEQCIVSKDDMVISTKYDLLKRFSNDVQIQGLIGEKKINKLDTLDTQKVLPYTNPVFEFDPKPLPIYRNMDKYVTEEDDGSYSMEIPTYGRDIMNITSVTENRLIDDFEYTIIGNIPLEPNIPYKLNLYGGLYIKESRVLFLEFNGFNQRTNTIIDYNIVDEETGNIITSGSADLKQHTGIFRIPIPIYNSKMYITMTIKTGTAQILQNCRLVYDSYKSDIQEVTSIIPDSISINEKMYNALTTDGRIISWGDDQYGQVSNTPKGTGYISVASGYFASIAINSNGSIVGWGYNHSSGVLDNIPEGDDFVQVTGTGYYTFCALKKDGSIVSWGLNTDNIVSNTPKENIFVKVSGGYTTLHGLTIDGRIISWGNNMYWQVSNTPRQSNFIDVSAHSNACTGITKDGELVTWGINIPKYGDMVKNTPKGKGYKMVSGGLGYTAYAIKSDGSIIGWGNNVGGSMSAIPEGNNFVSVYAGWNAGFAIDDAGKIHMWGANTDNQISWFPKDIDIFIPEYTEHTECGLYNNSNDKIDNVDIFSDNKMKFQKISAIFKAKKISKRSYNYLDINGITLGMFDSQYQKVISSNKLGLKYSCFDILYPNKPSIGEYLLENPSLLSKNSIRLYKSNLEDLQKIKIKYNANTTPDMIDFTADLSTVHNEHVLIRGDIIDKERDPFTITTTVVNNKVTIHTETLNGVYMYKYQKAFHITENLKVGSNVITITVRDDRGLSSSWNTTVVVENQAPNATYIFNDRYITALVNDNDGDMVKTTLENTTTKKVLDETEYLEAPYVYRYKFKPGDTTFNANNAMKLTFVDTFETPITSYAFNVKGVYMGIMFQDENGAYYSDDSGKILKPLDFKKINSGIDAIARIRVLNSTSYDLSKVRLTPEYGNLPDGVRIKLCEDILQSEEIWVDELVLPHILKNNDYVEVKVKIETDVGVIKLGADFGLSATGNIVVGRDGVPEEERQNLMRMGYTFSE